MCPVKRDTNPRTNRAVPRNTGEGCALLAALGEAPPPPECGFAGSGFLPIPRPYQLVPLGHQFLGGAADAGVRATALDRGGGRARGGCAHGVRSGGGVRERGVECDCARDKKRPKIPKLRNKRRAGPSYMSAQLNWDRFGSLVRTVLCPNYILHGPHFSVSVLCPNYIQQYFCHFCWSCHINRRFCSDQTGRK